MREVKMAGYWPSSIDFFACGVQVHKLAKKNNEAILTEQTWSLKDLLHGFREKVLSGHSG